MYSIDLKQISLNEFKEMLTSVDLLPGRRILLDELSQVVERFKGSGLGNLAALQKMLNDKKQYPELAKAWSVSLEYLTILNREINSYVSKPYPLSELGIFPEAELHLLENEGLKTTRDVYEQCAAKAARRDLSEQLGLAEEKILAALEWADLLRINGIGPVYAKILRTLGIRNAGDYLQADSGDLLARYQKVNAEHKAHLGIKDIEYCKRFCRKLSADIEW
jgi:hypothetical protein